MKRKNLTRNALFTSIISLLLCVSMLVGTTFAWFTDSVVSGQNVIAAGNLDVTLEYKTSAGGTWAPVTADTKIFNENALYEPGYTEIVFLRVANAGSLALKYNLGINVYSETTSTNVFGETFSLKDYLEIGCYAMDESLGQYLLGTMFGTREAALGAVTTTKLSAFNGMVHESGPIEAGGSPLLVALVLTMPESVGNEANHKTGVTAPSVTLGVNLVATQLVSESDSFGKDYDKDAEFPNVATTANDLTAALAQDENVVLANDITFTGVKQMPDRNNYVEVYGNKTGFAQYGGVLDGNGFELIDSEGDKSYVVVTHGGTIKNLTIKSGARGIVTYSPTEDVYIDNVVVDGAGYALNSTEHSAVNMVVTNSTINGWTSLAGFKSVSFNNCKLGENSLKYWQKMGYGQDYDRLFRVYSPTTYTRCEFEQGYYLDLSAGGTATLIDCTVNGVEITAENYAQYITIELPTGGNLADCVNFK